MKNCTGTILVVDDTPNNMALLHNLFSTEGFNVLFSADAVSCFEAVKYGKPDLILLDIMMPGLDGFQVCKHLKADADTYKIPIIFMTALNDTANKVKGFELGAVDYITKPFQTEEVLVRVKTHLNLVKLQKQLQKRSLELDSFAHTVASDLKAPLADFFEILNYLEHEYHSQKPVTTQASKRLALASASVDASFETITSLLMLAGVSRQQTVQLHTLNMASIVTNVKRRLMPIIERTQANITMPKTWPKAVSYAPWIEEIWWHYLSNALKYGGTPPVLQFGATQQTENSIQFWLKDNGVGLSPEQQHGLFTSLEHLKQYRQTRHGLGLSIIQQIANQLKITVGVTSEQGKGSTFYFILPIA